MLDSIRTTPNGGAFRNIHSLKQQIEKHLSLIGEEMNLLKVRKDELFLEILFDILL